VPATSWAKAISISWWKKVLSDIWDDAQNLIRVSRIDKPEASMLAPDQSSFVGENLKLRLLNAIVDARSVACRYRVAGQYRPLTSNLANVMLDEVDKELEKRGWFGFNAGSIGISS
jgi:HemX, putative uroporphyrinogen-III C-methyltransferase